MYSALIVVLTAINVQPYIFWDFVFATVTIWQTFVANSWSVMSSWYSTVHDRASKTDFSTVVRDRALISASYQRAVYEKASVVQCKTVQIWFKDGAARCGDWSYSIRHLQNLQANGDISGS